MTLKDIVLANLRRRKAKAAFVLIGLVVGIAGVVAFIGLVDALTLDINHKIEKYGANILIVPKTENLVLSYGGVSLGGVSFEMQEINQSDLDRIKTIQNAANVAAVGPMVLGVVDTAGQKVLLTGMDFQAVGFLRPWWKIQGERPRQEEALLGSEAARVFGLEPGGRMQINDRDLVVSGVLDPTGSQDDQMVFVPLEVAQSILNKEGRISMAEVAALCASCPIEEMIRQISEILPGAKVMAIGQVVQGRMETLGMFRQFAYGLAALVMFVGGLMVLITMMGSVRERTWEFGIFRTIGFTGGHLMRIVLMEAGIISVLAGLLGYLTGFAGASVAMMVGRADHAVSVPFDPLMAGAVVAATLLIGLAAGVYPAMWAARLDPSEALRVL